MIYLFNKKCVSISIVLEERVSELCTSQSENEDNEEVRVASQQKYGLCVGAANHITSIGRSLTSFRRM